MAYEIRTIKQIENKNIKLGKTFKYSISENYNLTNIYYITENETSTSSTSPTTSPTTTPTTTPITTPTTTPIKETTSKKQESVDEKTKLIIQTPLMYLPNSIIYFNEKPFLELSFNNEDNDKDVSEFKKWISILEDYIFKLIKKRSSLGIKKENMISIIKQKNANYSNSSTKILIPINMNVSKCILTDDNKKSKFLFNWEIPVPTYGISIIWVKNIWVKNGKWGINLFMYASRVMNSHILDPLDFLGLDGDNKSIKTYEVAKQFKSDEKMSILVGQVPEYTMFFKMLKLGIPKEAIKQKIELSNLDSRIIDYPDTTPYATVLHYISNPKLGPYVKSNNNPISSSSQVSAQDSSTNSLRPNIKLDLLKNINSGVKLKKVEKDKDNNPRNNIKEKILNTVNNTNGLKVPTLFDIQGALSKLKKVEIDTTNEDA
jgi:hypothetical protein